MPLNIVFWGSPEYAVPSLEAISASGHRIQAVITQPDRPAGRNNKSPRPTPVKTTALRLGIDFILTPTSTRDPRLAESLRVLNSDVYCVVAYGGILIHRLLKLPHLFTLNAHASLLPKYRGASPIQQTLLNEDPTAGVCLMKMIRKLDAGPVALQEEIPVVPEDTAGTLHDKLAHVSAKLFVVGLEKAEFGRLDFAKQDESRATFCHKVTALDASFDWVESAEKIQRKVRAYTPWPGVKVAFIINGRPRSVSLHNVTVLTQPAPPGSLVSRDASNGLVIGCGADCLQINQLQQEGKTIMPVRQWLRGVKSLALP